MNKNSHIKQIISRSILLWLLIIIGFQTEGQQDLIAQNKFSQDTLYFHFKAKYERFRNVSDFENQKKMLDSMSIYVQNLQSHYPEAKFLEIDYDLNLGVYFKDIDDVESAINQQQSLISKIPNPVIAPDNIYETYHYALHQLSDIHVRKSNFNQAVQYLDYSIRLENENASLREREPSTSSMECRKAELLDKLGAKEEARDIFKLANDRFLDKIALADQQYTKTYNYHFIGYFRKEVVFSLEYGNLIRARELLDKIREIETPGHINNHLTQLLWSKYYLKQNKQDSINYYFDLAQKGIFSVPLNYDEKLKYYLAYSDYMSYNDKTEEALKYLNRAEFIVGSIGSISSKWSRDMIITRTKKIRLLNQLGRGKQVVEEIEEFISEIENRLSGAIIFEDHLSFINEFYPIFEIGLSTIHSNFPDRNELAFRIIECTKSLSLYKSSVLSQSSGTRSQDSLILAYKVQSSLISQYKLQEAAGKSSSELKNQLYLATQKLDHVKSKLSKQNAKKDNLTLSKYQKKLDDETIHLLSFSGNRNYYLLSLAQSESKLLELNRIDFDLFLEDYITSISSFQGEGHVATGSKIYNVLKPALLSKSINKLIFSGDGLLGQIPLEALIDTKGNFMLEKTAVSYTPSAKIQTLLQNPSPSDNHMAIFRPSFSKEEIPLESTLTETSTIQQIMNAELYEEEKATKADFLAKSEQYNILHLATHAKGISNNPSLSHITFTNSKLNFDEIRTLLLDAKLVCLSACETNTGKTYNGEGVQSLARNFIASGARSVISSLWEIPDQTTSEITISFYKYLRKGNSKSEALQKAKIDFIKANPEEGEHPYNWAGLILTGNDQAIYPKQNWQYWTCGICLGFMVVGGIKYKNGLKMAGKLMSL